RKNLPVARRKHDEDLSGRSQAPLASSLPAPKVFRADNGPRPTTVSLQTRSYFLFFLRRHQPFDGRGTDNTLTPDLLLQLQETANQRFRRRRTTGDINVDRNNTLDTLDDMIAMLPVRSPAVRT